MIVLWIILGIIVLVGIALAVSYNRFVSQRQLIRNAFANIDTELKRRYDLIPNLVETVKGYAAHEREVFEEVTRARASAAATSGLSRAGSGPYVAGGTAGPQDPGLASEPSDRRTFRVAMVQITL